MSHLMQKKPSLQCQKLRNISLISCHSCRIRFFYHLKTSRNRHLLCCFHLCLALHSMSLVTWVNLRANMNDTVSTGQHPTASIQVWKDGGTSRRLWFWFYGWFYFTTWVVSLENPILEELFMRRLSRGFYKGGTRSKCRISSPWVIYKHKRSATSPGSPRYSEGHAPFSAAVSSEISHAPPSLFTWATNLVADHACHGIYGLTDKDDHVHHPTNGRRSDRVNFVIWGALGKFTIASLSKVPVSWYLWPPRTRTILWF